MNMCASKTLEDTVKNRSGRKESDPDTSWSRRPSGSGNRFLGQQECAEKHTLKWKDVQKWVQGNH